MSLNKFSINFKECDQSPKNRMNDWLDVLHTVYRYAKSDGLEAFADYIKRIYEEVSSFYPCFIVGKQKVKVFEYLGGEEAKLIVVKEMQNKLTVSELEAAREWLQNLKQSDFFNLLKKNQRSFNRAVIKKQGKFYSKTEQSHLSNMQILIESAIDYFIENI